MDSKDKIWEYLPLAEAVEICDSMRKPINNTGRQKRISGKSQDQLFPYYGATGQVGFIDDFITDGEFVLLGEDGAPFLDSFAPKAYIITGKTWVNNHAHILKSKLNNKFLCYYLNSFNYKGYVSGTTRLKLTQGEMKKIPIPVPPLPEQERIVAKIEELFSQLDAAVAELKSVKEKLAIYRQAVLKEAFEGKLTERWRTNNPDSNAESILSKIFQRKAKQPRSKTYSLQEDINLCELPDEWKWMFIGDITDAPEYGTSQKSLATGKVPVIRMGNLQKGIIDWSDLAFTNDENDISKYRLHQGDVLFNRTNSPELVGKTSIFQGERDAIFAGYLIRINHYEFINSRYLNHYMNSFVAKNYGSKVKTDGVNQSNINGQKMCSYPFPLCSEEEQEQVVYELEERLSTFDSIEQTVDIALQQAAALRQSILKQAFEGNL